MKTKKSYDPVVIENFHRQIDNLLEWAPDYGAIEIKVLFHDGRIAKTEEHRMVTVLRSGVTLEMEKQE